MLTLGATGVAAQDAAASEGEGEAAAASAASGDDDEARRHFRLGSAHFENGDFTAAAHEFEEALALSHRPELLYNIYLSYRDALDIRRAHAALTEYLRLVEHPPHDRAFLASRLAAMDAAVAAMGPEVAVETPVETPVSDGSDVTVETPVEDTTPVEPATVPGDFWDRGPAPYAVLGGGAAILIVGAVFAALSGDAESRLGQLCPGGACPDESNWEGLQSDGRAYAIAADTAFGVGAVTIATAVVLFFVVEPPRRPAGDVAAGAAGATSGRSPISVGCGAGGCGLRF